MTNLKLYSKSRKRRASPEAELQKAVVQYLNLAGVQGLLFFSVPNEQKCSVVRGMQLKKMGRLAGVSDLVVIIPNGDVYLPYTKTLFLELKAKGQKPSEVQCAFAEAAHFAGTFWEWADNLNAAIDILRVYGAIKNVPRRRPAQSLAA